MSAGILAPEVQTSLAGSLAPFYRMGHQTTAYKHMGSTPTFSTISRTMCFPHEGNSRWLSVDSPLCARRPSLAGDHQDGCRNDRYAWGCESPHRPIYGGHEDSLRGNYSRTAGSSAEPNHGEVAQLSESGPHQRQLTSSSTRLHLWEAPATSLQASQADGHRFDSCIPLHPFFDSMPD